MIKQVIVMRTDLNMRKGKMIAQAAHASIAWLTQKMEPQRGGHIDIAGTAWYELQLSPVEEAWVSELFTKICVRVDSEAELLEIRDRAEEAGVNCSLIQDAGLTEFGGVPTFTCLALGPDSSERIDPISGDLKLL